MNPAMMNKIKKMQRDMLEAQKKLEQSIFTGTAGGGMVKVEATGDKRIVNIEIDSEVLNPEDKEMIQCVKLMKKLKMLWVHSQVECQGSSNYGIS